MNVKMKNLFPSSKSRHTFCRVHRVYGMQNDRLDLTIIPAEKKNVRKFSVARDICIFWFIFLHLFCKYLGIQCIILQ